MKGRSAKDFLKDYPQPTLFMHRDWFMKFLGRARFWVQRYYSDVSTSNPVEQRFHVELVESSCTAVHVETF